MKYRVRDGFRPAWRYYCHDSRCWAHTGTLAYATAADAYSVALVHLDREHPEPVAEEQYRNPASQGSRSLVAKLAAVMGSWLDNAEDPPQDRVKGYGL